MGLEDWVANRWVVPHVATREEVAELLAAVTHRDQRSRRTPLDRLDPRGPLLVLGRPGRLAPADG